MKKPRCRSRDGSYKVGRPEAIPYSPARYRGGGQMRRNTAPASGKVSKRVI